MSDLSASDWADLLVVVIGAKVAAHADYEKFRKDPDCKLIAESCFLRYMEAARAHAALRRS